MKPLPAVAEDANALSNLSSIMLGFPGIVVWYVSLLTWPQRLQKHLHFLSFHFQNHLIKYPDKHDLILYRITPWNLSLAYQQKFVILAKKISNKTNILRKSRWCQCRFSSWRDLTYTHLCPSQQKGHVHISENSGFLYVFQCNYSEILPRACLSNQVVPYL